MRRTQTSPETTIIPAHRQRTRRRILAVVAAATLALAGCGGDDAEDPDAADDATTETSEAEPDETTTDDAPDEADDDTDEADGSDGADDPGSEETASEEPTTFDPANEQRFVDIEFTDRISGDTTQPFSNMVVPEDLPWPSDIVLIQAATDSTEQDEPVTSNDGAFRVPDPDADVDTVMGLFLERLPELGWELDEERRGESALWTRWLTRQVDHPDDGFIWETELRVEYLGPNESREQGTLRWWITNDPVRE